MPKLTDTQFVILNAAAGRTSHAILPLPRSLKINKGTASSVLKGMLAKGLVEEFPAKPGDSAWRQDDDGHGFGLGLSATGLAALDAGPKTSKTAQKANRTKKAPTTNSRPTGKAETILSLVSRPEGAKLTELQKATGWQPHSVRAALTGLRKRGIEVTRAKEGDTTVYHAKAA